LSISGPCQRAAVAPWWGCRYLSKSSWGRRTGSGQSQFISFAQASKRQVEEQGRPPDRYPSTHALVADWFNHTIYFAMFLLGAAFATPSGMWDRLARMRWFALALALGFWASLGLLRPGGLMGHAVVATFQWSAPVAACGFAKQHLDKDHPLRARMTEAVFPEYILHQTVIIVGSQVLLPMHLTPIVEGPVLVAMTFALSYAGYLLVRRIRGARP